jgi:hypothetical protein
MNRLVKLKQDHFIVVDSLGWTVASTQPYRNIEPLDITYIKELVGEVDIEKKARDKAFMCDDDWKDGYNNCLEDNKDKRFTVSDMRKAFDAGTKYGKEDVRTRPVNVIAFNSFLKPLKEKKTEWLCYFDKEGKLKLK